MLIYTVQNGDTLWKIAKAYQIGLDALLAANPQLSDPNYILAGSQINIPELWQPGPAPMPQPQPSPNYAPDFVSCVDDPEVRPCIYTAHQGDTLEMLGQVFMVPLTRLLYYNLSYAKNEALPEGARIVIPPMEIMPMNPLRNRPQQVKRKK